MIAPFADDLKRAREQALEEPINPELASIRRLTDELQACRQVTTNAKAATLLKRAQRNLELAQRELSDG